MVLSLFPDRDHAAIRVLLSLSACLQAVIYLHGAGLHILYAYNRDRIGFKKWLDDENCITSGNNYRLKEKWRKNGGTNWERFAGNEPWNDGNLKIFIDDD